MNYLSNNEAELDLIMNQINLEEINNSYLKKTVNKYNTKNALSLQEITFNHIYNNLHLYHEKDYNKILFSCRNNPKIIKLITQYLYTEQKLDFLIKIIRNNESLKKRIYYHMFPSLLKDKLISDYFLTKFDFNIQKFNQVTYNLFELDFCWDNCIVSGGILSKIIFEMDVNDPLFISSDIDLYLYGSKDDKINKLNYIIKYFSEKYQSRMILVNRYNIIELYFKGVNRKIQIICSNYYTPLEIISSFDFSHVGICFDGVNCWVTNDFIDTYNTKVVTTNFDPESLKYERIHKLFKLGLIFDISKLEHDLDFILNDDKITDNINNYYYPSLNDEIDTITKKLDEIKIIKTEYQVNNYNFTINWNLEFDFKNQHYFNHSYLVPNNFTDNVDIELIKNSILPYYNSKINVLYFKHFYYNDVCKSFEIHYRTDHIMDKNKFLDCLNSDVNLSLYNDQQKFDNLEIIINKLISKFTNYEKNKKVQEYWNKVFKYSNITTNDFSFNEIKSPLKYQGDSFWVNSKLNNKTKILNHDNLNITLDEIDKFKKNTLHFELSIQIRIQYIFKKKLTKKINPSIGLFVSRLKFLNI